MAVAEITIGQSVWALWQHTSNRFVMVEGPRGTGKTRGILCFLMCYALEHPGARILLARSSRTRLSESVLQTLELQVFPAFGLTVPGAADTTHRSHYRLENGSVFIPVGLDDQSRSQSAEYAMIYVAEGTELDELDDVVALAASLRQTGMPNRQLIVDCNPSWPTHWLNEKAETVPKSLRRVRTREDYELLQQHNRTPAANPKAAWKRIVTRHEDNPGYFDVDSWSFKPEGEEYIRETLDHYTGHLRRRWLDGEWAGADGSVYPEFDEEKHVVDPFPNGIPFEWECVIAEDPGYDHPTAIIVAAIAPNGRIYICAEVVKRETTVKADAIAIDGLCKVFNVRDKLGDPHYMFSKNKHNSGESIAMQMRKFGHNFRPAPAARNQTEIAQQVEMVRTLLTTLGPDGKPMLQVMRTCRNTIRGFQSWGYERTVAGKITGGEDRFQDIDDDEMDCVRMLVSARINRKREKIKVY